MQETKSFPNDNNETLKSVQRSFRNTLLGYLFIYPRERYIRASELIGVDTDLRAKIEGIESVDPDILGGAYDLIAAYYRYSTDQGGQIPLFIEGESYEEDLVESWCEHFHREAKRLADNDPIAKSILGAVAYRDTDKGAEAKNHLSDLLEDWYGDMR